MAYDRARRVRNALALRTNTPGMCLKHIRLICGVAARYPDAKTAWARARSRHTDRNPPAGFPVFFLGGTHGHIALSLGGGKIRTTDWPRARVGTTTIAELERRWRYRYVGWSEDLNGVRLR